MTACDCEGPGFCSRHHVWKNAHWVHLCRTRANYWAAGEAGRGPGQLTGQPDLARPKQPGLGDKVTSWLSAVGVTEDYY